MRADSWTEERIGLLKTLWAVGETAQAISDRLGGVSRSAVLGKVFRLRLAPAAPPPAAPRRDPSTKADAQLDNVRASSPRRRRRRKHNDLCSGERPARPRGKKLFELTNETCRWPHGRPGTARFFFCGAPGADLERGMPYCAQHAQRAYVKCPSIGEEPKQAVRDEVQRIVSPARPRPFVWRAPVRHPAPRRR